MSQRKEKYARHMERRVVKLENRVERMDIAMTSQAIRILSVEGNLDTYNAIARAGGMNVANEGEVRKQRGVKRRGKAKKRNAYVRAAVILLLVALGVFAMNKAYKNEQAKPVRAASEPSAIEADPLASVLTEVETAEDPLEAEKIEEALLAQGYFSLAVPMCYDYQDYMRTYSEAYGCPYPLALAVAEVESNFSMDAVGACGEIGIMQLNPGPGRAYFDELEEVTGLDPTTPAGNIAGGCYCLGEYMENYGDPVKAAMAYNMGGAGAEEAWTRGIASTEYSDKVMAAMERWGNTVDVWRSK